MVSKEELSYTSDLMSDSYDKVLVGISEEYGNSILDSAVETIIEMGGITPGDINFSIGSHAECGSSKVVFSQVTRILLKLSQYDLLNMTEIEIVNVLEAMF